MADDLVDIDPSGDVVLVCGQGEDVKKLRVSSKVLSLGSPVFKTMLGPNFKEGKQLSIEGTLDLPLPDDHGSTMRLVCYSIHLRHGQVDRNIDIETLRQVAVLAGKYDMCAALSPIAEHWIRELREECSDQTRISLISSAYLLRLSVPFAELGSDHVNLNTTPARDLISCLDPTDLIPLIGTLVGESSACLAGANADTDAIDAESLSMRSTISSFIEEEIAELCGLCEADATANCSTAHRYGISFLKDVKAAGLWPRRAILDDSLRSQVDKLRSFKISEVKPTSGVCLRRSHRCYCDERYTNEHVIAQFEQRADQLSDMQQTLCLECTLRGGTWKKTNCEHAQRSGSTFVVSAKSLQ